MDDSDKEELVFTDMPIGELIGGLTVAVANLSVVAQYMLADDKSAAAPALQRATAAIDKIVASYVRALREYEAKGK